MPNYFFFQDGVFDMDYHFRFAPRGGGRVSIKEYRDWRSTGMAFKFEEDLGNLYIEVMFQCLFNGFLLWNTVHETSFTPTPIPPTPP